MFVDQCEWEMLRFNKRAKCDVVVVLGSLLCELNVCMRDRERMSECVCEARGNIWMYDNSDDDDNNNSDGDEDD